MAVPGAGRKPPRGTPAFGFAADVWTHRRVATVIAREWLVTYHPGYVACLLRAYGWSRQKFVCRARQRDESLILGTLTG